jgi:hypothetical protein
VSLSCIATERQIALTFNLRTVELGKRRRDSAGQDVQCRADIPDQTLQDVRDDGQQRLIPEADQVVSLQQGLRVVHPARQVGEVDAGERVDSAEVASDGDSLWHGELQFNGFEGKSGDGILVTDGSSVPVLAEMNGNQMVVSLFASGGRFDRPNSRNALVTPLRLDVALGAGDAKE